MARRIDAAHPLRQAPAVLRPPQHGMTKVRGDGSAPMGPHDSRIACRTFRWAFAVVSMLLLVAVFVVPSSQATRALHSWNLFHYVLGTKYFHELGYYDLYGGLLLADEANAAANGDSGVLIRAPLTRDLHSYDFVPVPNALADAHQRGLRQRFTGARFAELRRDLATILRQRPADFWHEPIRDRGFNPSPVWLLLHQPLLNLVDVSHERTLLFLCLGQNLLFLFTFWGVYRAFGGRAVLLFVAFFYLYFGNGGRPFGGYFSYDWFLLTTWAIVLHARQRFATAALLLGYAAMMRGFPILFALYPAVQWTAAIARRRWPARRHSVFLGTLVVTCAALFGLSCFAGSGVAGSGVEVWTAWLDKIAIHRHHHILTESRIGLQYLFAQDYAGGQWELPLGQREALVAALAPAYRVTAAALTFLLALTMVRCRDREGMVLGILAVFFLSVLSRYYFALAALLVLVAPFGDEDRLDRAGKTFLFSLLLLFIAQWALMPEVLPRQRYFAFNLGITFYAVAVIAVRGTRDLRHVASRFRSWRK